MTTKWQHLLVKNFTWSLYSLILILLLILKILLVNLSKSLWRWLIDWSCVLDSREFKCVHDSLVNSAASFFLPLKPSSQQSCREETGSPVRDGKSQMVCYPWRFSRCNVPTATAVEVSVSGFKQERRRKTSAHTQLPSPQVNHSCRNHHYWGQRLKYHWASHPKGREICLTHSTYSGW